MEFTKNIESKFLRRYNKIYGCVDMIDPDDLFHIGHFTAIKCDDDTCDLTFLHGGPSLDKIDYDNVDNKRFLKGFENIFKAISILNSHDIIHNDIKTPNICMNEHYEFKLIDFGISFKSSKPQKSMEIFAQYYSCWPPEAVVLCTYTSDLITEHIDMYINDKYLQRILPYSMHPNFRVIITECINKMSIADRDQICQKIDIYSLGLTVFDITRRLKKLDRKICSKLRKLTHFMTHPDITKRPTINDSYRTYHRICSEL